MKLSQNAREYLNICFGKKADEISKWDQGVRRRLEQLPPGGARNRALADQTAARIRKLAQAQVELYVDTYQKEGKVLDVKDIDEIVQGITRIVTHGFQLAAQLRQCGLSHISEIQSQIIAEARRDLVLAMKKAAMESKPAAIEIKATSPLPPAADLSFMADSRIRTTLERDCGELQRLERACASKSALVLSGGIIEGLLLDALVSGKKWTFEEGSKKYLKDMIGPALGAGIIREDRLTDAIRKYRALIHPGREIREEIVFSEEDASIARAAVHVTIREVREWYDKRSKTTP